MHRKFHIIISSGIDIVNDVILGSQALCYLRISDASFLCTFKFEICLNFFIDILNAYDNVFFIVGQHR